MLDNLFRIDHLTTRMRRNAQSLLVLAGAEPTRRWAPPVPIGDVVRAALSEVENYGQVELADVGDVAVLGAVAGEVSHLLAELLENATSFSPPNSSVTVVGRAVPDGHQLAIFDYGLGMIGRRACRRQPAPQRGGVRSIVRATRCSASRWSPASPPATTSR